MTHARLAYMPLATYPETVDDATIQAALGFAGAIDCTTEVRAFAVDLPRVSSGLGDYIINIPGVIQAAEQRSRDECDRLQGLVLGASRFATRTLPLGVVPQAAATEARYFDLVLLPWVPGDSQNRDLIQEIVFESGRPAILLPSTASAARLEHIAIAWDGSRVAARALGDALPLLAVGGQVTVVTVENEKPLLGRDIGHTLASWLEHRGYSATATAVALGGREVADALQEAAISCGAGLLAMGGFGHSRIRDFVLGGATRGVLARAKLPVLLSH
jgi:nucleotide-binding universal stress UspA family protein